MQPRPWVRIPPPPLTAPQTLWLSRVCAMATRRLSDDDGSDRPQFAPARPHTDHRQTVARRRPGHEHESASGGGRAHRSSAEFTGSAFSAGFGGGVELELRADGSRHRRISGSVADEVCSLGDLLVERGSAEDVGGGPTHLNVLGIPPRLASSAVGDEASSFAAAGRRPAPNPRGRRRGVRHAACDHRH